MAYNYTPTYDSSLQDTISSLCKSILPFSLKNRRLPSQSDLKLSKHQSDNLKWQQESFHRILNLIGLHKEGIVSESDVSTFRSHLLDTLIASPVDHEPSTVIRDKLLFLQELLYAKCISAEDYHSSKRPLLQRLAVQGVEISCRDVIVGGADEETEMMKNKMKHPPSIKQIKGAESLIGNSVLSLKSWKGNGKKDVANSVKEPVDLSEPFKENPFWVKEGDSESHSILMPESSPPPKPCRAEKSKRKVLQSLFQKEQREGNGSKDNIADPEEKVSKSSKKHWGFDGFKKWKRNNCEDESATPYLLPQERSDDTSSIPCILVASPIGEGPNMKRIKKEKHSDGSASDLFVDKVLGDNIKKELSRIQSELCTTNTNLNFSNDQIEAISTRLPVDKTDLKNFFPKSWCDKHGDIVLDVVRKEFKDRVGEMETLRNAAREKLGNAEKWVAFGENDENFHPNLFVHGG